MSQYANEVPEVEEEPYFVDKFRTRWTKNFRFVEPVHFLVSFSIAVLNTVETNIIEIQYCKAALNICDQAVCLNTTASHFTEVQKYTSTFLMYQTMCISIFPAISSMFLGPWSDTFGRRPLLLLSIFGYALLHFQYTWGSTTNIHPSYFLLFYLPIAMTGDGIVLKLASYCYICDTTTTNTRAFRLGVLFGWLATGSLAGTLAVPYLQNIGFSFTLAICTVASIMNFLYVLIFLKESVSTTQTQRKLVSKNPFQWSQVRNLFEACFVKHRALHVSQSLVLAILLIVFSTIQLSGENIIFYLLLQEEFGWTLTEYSWLQSFSGVVAALAAVIGPSKMLGLSDLQLLSLVTGIHFLSVSTLLLGQEKWLIYMAGAMSHASSINGIIIRSFLSKVIDIADVGKVFVLCGIVESSSLFIGAPIYSMVYKETLVTNPRAIFLVSIVMCLLMTVLIILLTRINTDKGESYLLSGETHMGDMDANYAPDGNSAKNGTESTSRIETIEEGTPMVGRGLASAKLKTIATEIANLF